MSFKGAAAQVYNPDKQYTLNLDVTFAYRKTTKGKRHYLTENRFSQKYDLNLDGFVWDPRFISFRTRAALSKVTTKNGGFESKTKPTRYSLAATLLPRKPIPLTFFFDRATSRSETADYVDETTNDRYGLFWHLKFRRLPVTRLFFNTTRSDGETTGSDYGMSMDKRLWETKFRFFSDTSKDDKNGREANSKTFDFYKRKELSTDKSFISTGNYNVTKMDGPEVTDKTGYSYLNFLASLKVDPHNKRSNQYYYYRFSRDRRDSEADERVREEHTLLTRTYYRVTEKLTFSGNGRFEFSKEKSNDSKIHTKRAALAAGLSYEVTSRLSTRVATSYNRTITEQVDKKSYSLSTGFNYNYKKRLRWTDFHAGYGLSFAGEVNVDNDSTVDRGYIIGHNLNLNFSRIDILGISRYAAIRANYRFSKKSGYRPADEETNHIIGLSFSNIDILGIRRYAAISANYRFSKKSGYPPEDEETNHIIGLNFSNIDILGIRRYAVISANYRFSKKSGYSPEDEATSHTVEANTISTYFKRTTIRGKLKYRKTRRPLEGTRARANIGLNIRHHMRLYRGKLELSFKHSTRLYDSTKRNYRLYRNRYRARYGKLLTWRTKLMLVLMRSTSATNDSNYRSITDALSVKLFHRLRAWLLKLEYTNSSRKEMGEKDRYKESMILLEVKRSFGRVF